MAAISLKSLFNKLNTLCQQRCPKRSPTANAAATTTSKSNTGCSPWPRTPMPTCGKSSSNTISIRASVVTELTLYLDKLRRGSEAKPGWAIGIEDGIREAWVLTSLEYNWGKIRSGTLLTALLNDRAMSLKLVANVPSLAKLPPTELMRDLKGIVAGSAEDELESQQLAASGGGPTQAQMARGELEDAEPRSVHDRISPSAPEGRDRSGHRPRFRDSPGHRHPDAPPAEQSDPHRRGRRRQDGRRRRVRPAGRGRRCAAAAARASRCARSIWACCRPAPASRASSRIASRRVIAEVKASPQPIILFIDEAHTIIGAGGAAGQGDAANLLKPALARGELRTIAATTWMEYKKYFETDPALKRRFQVVKVEEPDDRARPSRMMRGVAATLEKHHKVRILDEAVEDAVKLSHRYITDRQLPDKAVSLLDTACARVGLEPVGDAGRAGRLPARDLEHLDVEIGILRAREDRRRRPRQALEGTRREEEGGARQRKARKRWTRKQAGRARSQKLVAELDAQPLRQAEDRSAPKPARNDSRASWSSCEQQLHEAAGRDAAGASRWSIGQAVAAVVSGWTGIPVGKMVLDEIKTVLSLRENAGGARHRPDRTPWRRSPSGSARLAANLLDPRRPIGVFLLVGPSGVGKTETAHGPGRHPLRRRPQHGRSSTCRSTRKTTRSRA